MKLLLVCLLVAAVLVGHASAQTTLAQIQTRFNLDAAGISKLVIFGDQLSDMDRAYALTGGLFPNPAEYNGFVGPVCNGPLWWVQMNNNFLQSNLDVNNRDQVANFAYISAGLNSDARPQASSLPTNPPVVVPGFLQQINMYFSSNTTTPSGTLFIHNIGTNEFINNPPATVANPAFIAQLIGEYITGIATIASQCAARGVVCNQLVVGLLPIGSSPLLNRLVGNQTAQLNSLINVWNANLRAQILNTKYAPECVATTPCPNPPTALTPLFQTVQWADPTAEFARMAGKPGQYGFLVDGGPLQGPAGAYCAELGSTERCRRVNNFYWWNPAYTSRQMHFWFGNKVFNEAFQQGEEAFFGYF